MPTISVTQDEYDAIMFFKGETEDKAENAEDELYLADCEKHFKAINNFRRKFQNAKTRDDGQKIIKQALNIAKSKEIKS